MNEEIVDEIKRQINLTRTCILSKDASVSLSEGAKLELDQLV